MKSTVDEQGDKNLQEFIRLLEQKKDLKSFSRDNNTTQDTSMGVP
jgi:hypothetical protein